MAGFSEPRKQMSHRGGRQKSYKNAQSPERPGQRYGKERTRMSASSLAGIKKWQVKLIGLVNYLILYKN